MSERPTEALRERIKAYDAEESPWQQTIGKADMYHEADRIDATIAAKDRRIAELEAEVEHLKVWGGDHDEQERRLTDALRFTPPAEQPAPATKPCNECGGVGRVTFKHPRDLTCLECLGEGCVPATEDER